jgi:hypothetical protein
MADFAIVLWCWKGKGRNPWKGRIDYGPALVNMQARAIRRNMSLPFELVCVTDYPADQFDSSIRLVDATEHFGELADLGKCYRRLKAFDPSMKELFAPRFAWLDLDMIVVRDLAPLFDHPHSIRCWRSESLSGQPINGSIVQMDAGAHAHVWRDFDVGKTPAAARMHGFKGSDQACMAYALGKDIPLWSWQDGVMHLGRNCGRSGVPEHARVIFTPGGAKMTDPIVQHRYPWIRPLLEQDTPTGDIPAWGVGEWTKRHPDDKPKFRLPQWRRMQEVRQEMRQQAIRDRQARR